MKPRLSFSIIKYYLLKDYEKMVDAFAHLQQIDTQPMQDGRKFDEEECDHVTKNGRFSERLGGIQLSNPVCQDKWEVETERYTLVAKPDVYDDTRIFEIKTGKKNSTDYSKTIQLDIYLMASYFLKKNIDLGYYLHYDLKNKRMDWHMVISSKERSKQVFIEVNGYCIDIVNYLEREGLI
jgi:hypothetical protein